MSKNEKPLPKTTLITWWWWITYDWEDNDRSIIRKEYDDEAEAYAAAKKYALDYDIKHNSLTKIEVVRTLKVKQE